jgi:HD-like signal output (HDOD) protein
MIPAVGGAASSSNTKPTPFQATDGGRRVRAALLQKVCGDEDMFALGSAIARVVQMSTSEDQGTHDLAHYVLSDVALTQRILRLANTVRYRTAAGTAVTTVSRAISLLGFDNVRTVALAMLLVDALASSDHAYSVRVELEASLCASLVGREMARHSFYQGAEEASIGALFKNLGALLVASHEHDRYREIHALLATNKHTPAQAAQMILGCSFDALSEAVLGEWKIPDVIMRAQRPLETGTLKLAVNRGEWMRQVASFSLDVARLMGKTPTPSDTPEAQALLARYGTALNLGASELDELFETVAFEMTSLLQSMNLQPVPRRAPQEDKGGLPNVLLLATLGGEEEDKGCYPSGKPKNARDLLLAGVQDVTQMRASGRHKVNDVVMAVLETLYTALGFRFATVVLKDVRAGQYRARASFGLAQARVQEGFTFPLAPAGDKAARDLFYLAMENDADLMISDARSAKIRDLLPAWHKALLPDAQSFIVLPLVVGKVQLGLFYADRTELAPEGVPPDETALIKALKGQVLAALAP